MLVKRAAHVPHLHDCTSRPLAYKPERRFVARLNGLHDSTAVLRLYTPDRFSAAAVAATALRSNGMLHIPRRIGQSNRYGALLLEWLPGASLREVLAREYDALPVLERVGAALALLHGQSARRLPGPPTASHVAGSLESAAVRALQPQLARSAADVAALIQLLLANRPAPLRPLHGDFHMDQVVVMHSGIGFVDLDRAHRGDPAADLGNFLANLERDAIDAKVAATALPAMRDALLGGYGGGDPALRERVHLHTAAALLRLVAEPFRCRATDWPDQMQRIVTRAGEIALLMTDDVACRTGDSWRLRVRRRRVPRRCCWPILDMAFLRDALVASRMENQLRPLLRDWSAEPLDVQVRGVTRRAPQGRAALPDRYDVWVQPSPVACRRRCLCWAR
jgi:aminoglycoside phosphotransferase (APT) family kinase protein